MAKISAARARARAFSQLAFQAPPPAPTRRVVVTGLGAVTPYGVGLAHSWDALLSSQSAIKVRRVSAFIRNATICSCTLSLSLLPHTQTIDALDASGFACSIAGQVPRGDGEHAFRAKDWANPKSLRSQDVDFIAFALAAGASCACGCLCAMRSVGTHKSLADDTSTAREAIEDSGWTPASDAERERAVRIHSSFA